ncbi:MAG: RNA polymerase factor sigma-54 [Burkholderiales bacterium]|nr:RNA polymerase factor sigma-54 [Burkholderiales bacterium]
MSSFALLADQRQQQTFSPLLQHAVRLLQMSSQDYADELQALLERNPFLDLDDSDGADEEPAIDDGDRGDRELWLNDGLPKERGASDPEGLSALDGVAADTSLADYLHAQLAGQRLGERERLLAKVIIDSLDDDGYLRTELGELIALAELSPPATLEDLEDALQRVQSLGPAGVAARDVQECLLLQLSAIERLDDRRLAEAIIGRHLPRLAAHDTQGLARMLGRAPSEIEHVCDHIRHLSPRPGWQVSASPVQYIRPDVLVRKLRGVWTAQLNPAVIPKLRLNQVYAEMFERGKRQGNVELGNHLHEARWTLRNVAQRFSTIFDVTQAIVRRQQQFLEFGTMAMKPLGLREIADELGMHESTVSRVTNNKYMATPSGVFELRYFFSRAMLTASGKACSGTAIRGLVKEMIEQETATLPLSDAEIARQLARQGLSVARRTVTKYRQQLRIEAVDRRRQVV